MKRHWARVAVLAGVVTSLTAAPVWAEHKPSDGTASEASPTPALEKPAPSDPVAAPATAPATAAPPLDIAPRPWLAQTPAPKVPSAPEPSHGSLRSVLMLLVVACLAGAALYAKKRKRIGGKPIAPARLRVISSVRVGPKGLLVLAAVGDRNLLLGVTDDSVRRIGWLAGEPATLPQAPEKATTFPDLLRAHLPPGDKDESSPAVRLAAINRDEVEWSKDAKAERPAAALAAPRRQAEASPSPVSLEQQAAGIMKRKARRRG